MHFLIGESIPLRRYARRSPTKSRVQTFSLSVHSMVVSKKQKNQQCDPSSEHQTQTRPHDQKNGKCSFLNFAGLAPKCARGAESNRGRVFAQGGGQTLLTRRASAASGAPTWRAPKFEIRSGKVVTLAQMFYYGSELSCTAYDIYQLYMDLPIFIHKQMRQRSSKSPRGE